MGTYTPNYNLYMPSIGEQGWGELVSNNFEILDTNLNDLQDQIDVINTNIGNGTRTLTLTGSASSTPNFQQYWESTVYVTYINGNYTFATGVTPSSSARLCLIICNGNLTITGNLDTYPTSLRSEYPPSSASTNTYRKTISTSYSDTITLPYTKSNNSAVIEFSKSDLKSFLDAVNYTSVNYTVSIPAATASGFTGPYGNGTAGTATNTCNGGGGGGQAEYSGRVVNYTGGTGCIFGQYAGGSRNTNGYGYGSSASNKYRCGLIIFVVGNLIINNTITQNGGNGSSRGDFSDESYIGGYGGGAGGSRNTNGNYGNASSGGGGGAPVFIYYSGTYTNNGTINTSGGRGSGYSNGCKGGAGGIKTTKITL